MPFAGLRAAITTTLIALMAGCLSVDGVPCGDRVCAAGAACDEARGVCLTPEQVLACEDKADLDPCTIGGAAGSCQGGACFVPFCGDHIRNGAEECEDNDFGGADCQTLGFYDAANLACTSHCTFDTNMCAGYCGDRVANDVEVCDGQIPATDSCLEFGYDAGALSCRSSCVPDISRCEPGINYTVQNPTTSNLKAVWGTGPDNVYVVGAGTVMHWNGTAWTDLAPPSTVGLAGVWGFGSEVFVVGGQNRQPAGTGMGVIQRWNGTTWTQWTSPVNEALRAVWGTSATNVFAVGYNGAAIRFTGGASWSTLNSRTTQHLAAIWGTAANDIWAVGDAGTIDHWTGTQWSETTVGTESLLAVSGSGPNDVYAVGANGTILRYRNNAWTPQPSFTAATLEAVWSLGTGDFITTGLGEIYRFNNGTIDTIIPSAGSLVGMWASGLDNIYLVGDAGAVVRMRLAGWSRMASGIVEPIEAIWGSSPTDIIAVGYGEILRWNGSQWSPEACGGGVLLGVWGSAANNVIAVGANGSICRWNGAWSFTTTGASSSLKGVWGSGANDIYAVGDDTATGEPAKILHWTGSAWAPDVNASMLLDIANAVWGSGANDVYVVGAFDTGGAVLHWDGLAWARVTTTNGWIPHAVWGSGPRDVFVVGDNGRISHWNGNAWTEHAFGPTQTFSAVWGTGPSNVYAAGDELVHWNGSSWAPMKRNSASSMSGLWGTSTGRDLYAVGGFGTIMRRVRTCSAAESSCDDGDDEDCDGRIDCADPDCSSACGGGGVCAGFATLACNTTVSATTAGGETRIDLNGCDTWGRTGRERAYRVQPAAGTVTATLSELTRDLDITVFAQAATGGCDPFSGCVATSADSGADDETVTFTAQAGETYYLVVDGFGGTSSSFTLSVECP